jgi:hypothetical protein
MQHATIDIVQFSPEVNQYLSINLRAVELFRNREIYDAHFTTLNSDQKNIFAKIHAAIMNNDGTAVGSLFPLLPELAKVS